MTTITQWFTPNDPPVNIGVYQTCEEGEQFFHMHGYQFWDGEAWGLFNTSPFTAMKEKNNYSSFQNNYWRGLTEKQS